MPKPTAQCGLELYEFKLGPETAVGTVVERAERRAGKVVLHITWIPVVSDIEDSYSHPASVLFFAVSIRDYSPATERSGG